MAHTAEGYRLDKLAANRHVEERPCEGVGPVGIAREGAALGRRRGRGRKAREHEYGLHLKKLKRGDREMNDSDPQVNSNNNQQQQQKRGNKREATVGAKHGCCFLSTEFHRQASKKDGAAKACLFSYTVIPSNLPALPVVERIAFRRGRHLVRLLRPLPVTGKKRMKRWVVPEMEACHLSGRRPTGSCGSPSLRG